MTTARTAFRLLILDSAPVVALIGDRVYQSLLPEGISKPCVTMHKLDDEKWHGNQRDIDHSDLLVQCNYWATTVSGAEALRDAVATAVNRFTGTFETVPFQDIKSVGQRDIETSTPDLFGVGEDWLITYGAE